MSTSVRKILSLLLSATLMVGGFAVARPMTAWAAAPISGPLDFDSMATTDKLADEGWAWDAGTNTLTLNGFDLNCDDTGAAIMLPAGVGSTIVLNGANSITNSGGYGIYSYRNLSIEGGGTLNITTKYTGINGSSNFGLTIGCGALEINSSEENGISGPSVTINGGSVSITSRQEGIAADPDITINGGSINIASDGIGLLAAGNITINGGSGTIKGSPAVLAGNSAGGGTIPLHNGIVVKGADTSGYTANYIIDSVDVPTDAFGHTINGNTFVGTANNTPFNDLWFGLPSSDKSITSFAIPGQVGKTTITSTSATIGAIALTMPYGTDVTRLIPTIAVSANAVVSPASGVVQDFTNPVTYTVTAQDGSTKTYKVTVTATKDAPVGSYSITGGADSSWRKGTVTGAVITCDGDISRFTGANMDGAPVNARDYTAVPGSTIVTFKPTYLNTLALGKHTVEFVYTNGSAATSLTILAAPAPTPKPTPKPKPNDKLPLSGLPSTGDQSLPVSGFAIGLLVALGLGGLALIDKRYFSGSRAK